MADPVLLSARDAARLERVIRTVESQTDTRYQRRRRHGQGGRGGGGGVLAYCKTDAPDSDEIAAYLKADLLVWDNTETYQTNAWVEVGGTDYKSLQDDNLKHAVTDSGWWESGTKSVTVRCLIHNGSLLSKAEPFLKDGAEILVHKVGDEWICPGFNGAKVTT